MGYSGQAADGAEQVLTEGNEGSQGATQSDQIGISFVSVDIFRWRRRRFGKARHSDCTPVTLMPPDDSLEPCCRRDPPLFPLAH
jgi:hypothetical protein